MEIKEMQALIEALKTTDYSYIKIKHADTVIELDKKSHQKQVIYEDCVPESVQVQKIQSEAPDNCPVCHVVTSPIVGTYYQAPGPDTDAFVKVGDVVKKDQTLCIIEAMKLMNEIESDVSGEILEVLVEDGAAVEYGQPLYKIKK